MHEVRERFGSRLLSIVLEKRAYYAPGSAQSFWQLCRNCARFSELCSSHLDYAAWFLSEIKAEHRVNTSVRRGGRYV